VQVCYRLAVVPLAPSPEEHVNKHRLPWVLVLMLASLATTVPIHAQSKGLKVIAAAEMKPHVAFLGAREFRGRSAPSVELDIAAKYIAVQAAAIGLQPLMPDGSYFQSLPVEVMTVSPLRSYVRVTGPVGELTLRFPQAFTSSVRVPSEWAASGGLLFGGNALSPGDPAAGVQALGDVRGKFVVVLEVPVPVGGSQVAPAASIERMRLLREKGAVGLITIVSPAREKAVSASGQAFDLAERLRFLDVDTGNPAPPGQQPPAVGSQAAFHSVEVRHAAAAAMLGVPAEEVGR